jgi:phosphoribosylformylglycinamidine synthase subunit PurQ / glutaminase
VTPEVGIVVFPGSNCELDCERSFGALGGNTRFIWHEDTELPQLDIVVLPGGFAHGDYLRTGALARFSPIMPAVAEHADRGKLLIGICNGFQVLCEAGLLPGALRKNEGLKFLCKWTEIRVEVPDTAFTARAEKDRVLRIPINHFEGNWYAPTETLEQMRANEQILFRYVKNPNGSLDGVAGITNERGNVLGMMPHPERACEALLGSEDGAIIITSMFDWVLQNRLQRSPATV